MGRAAVIGDQSAAAKAANLTHEPRIRDRAEEQLRVPGAVTLPADRSFVGHSAGGFRR